MFDELEERHRSAAMIVGGLFALTALLVVIAFAAKDFIYRPVGSPELPGVLRILTLFLGLGAITLRRTKFSAMWLQDIAGLRGISGLLATLQRTTVQVAFLGGTIALIGFIITILTGDPFDMLRTGGVAALVLFYCYPRRNAWRRVVHGVQETGDADDPPAKGNTA